MSTPTFTPATLLRARRAICVLLVAFVLGSATPATAAEDQPSLGDLRRQRTELVRRIAALTDQAAASQIEAADARARQQTADAALVEARRRFARHAVDAYVDGVADTEELRLRRKGWSEVLAATDREIFLELRRAEDTAQVERRAAEKAVNDAHRTKAELDELLSQLQKTITEKVAADAASARARRAAQGTTGSQRQRFSRTTRSQAELMATYPFGPVAGVPAGLVSTGQVVEGRASWYGPGFDGRPTASGAIFDQEAFTVASRTLPFGTMLLIHHGGRSVLALVNDRGPFVGGRVLDLSHGVAAALGTVHAGVAPVRAEILVPA